MKTVRVAKWLLSSLAILILLLLSQHRTLADFDFGWKQLDFISDGKLNSLDLAVGIKYYGCPDHDHCPPQTVSPSTVPSPSPSISPSPLPSTSATPPFVSPTLPGNWSGLLEQLIAQLAQQLDLNPEQISIYRYDPATWRNSCKDCELANRACLQVMTSGLRVILSYPTGQNLCRYVTYHLETDNLSSACQPPNGSWEDLCQSPDQSDYQ